MVRFLYVHFFPQKLFIRADLRQPSDYRVLDREVGAEAHCKPAAHKMNVAYSMESILSMESHFQNAVTICKTKPVHLPISKIQEVQAM